MAMPAWVLMGGLVGGEGAHLPAANVADTCQWPTVVGFRASDDKCSGTLVHPEVVITAAHCLVGGAPAGVRFGEAFSLPAHKVDFERCWSRPGYAEGVPGEDLAVCRLVTPLTDVPITPLLGACEAGETIREGADVVLVGFGIPAAEGDFGTKRYAFTRIVEGPREDGTFVAGDAMVNGCDGDSGGPAFVQRSDGTWHVAGVLVLGPPCGEGPSRYLSAATHLEWLETTVERDLSPCRDPDGAWVGGADCRAADDPLRVADAWDVWCDGSRTAPVDACVGIVPQPEPADDSEGSSESGRGAEGGASADDAPVDAGDGHDRGCRVAAAPGSTRAVGLLVTLALVMRRRRKWLIGGACRGDGRVVNETRE